MNTKHSVKVIKNGKRIVSQVLPRVESESPKRWSATVGSWIREFHKQRRDDPLQAFDSLFK